MEKKTGIELIAEERQEQIEKHGFDVRHDANYYKKEELKDAALYCLTLNLNFYPKSWGTWLIDNIRKKQARMSKSDFDIEMNKIAAALLAANIDNILLYKQITL